MFIRLNHIEAHSSSNSGRREPTRPSRSAAAPSHLSQSYTRQAAPHQQTLHQHENAHVFDVRSSPLREASSHSDEIMVEEICPSSHPRGILRGTDATQYRRFDEKSHAPPHVCASLTSSGEVTTVATRRPSSAADVRPGPPSNLFYRATPAEQIESGASAAPATASGTASLAPPAPTLWSHAQPVGSDYPASSRIQKLHVQREMDGEREEEEQLMDYTTADDVCRALLPDPHNSSHRAQRQHHLIEEARTTAALPERYQTPASSQFAGQSTTSSQGCAETPPEPATAATHTTLRAVRVADLGRTLAAATSAITAAAQREARSRADRQQQEQAQHLAHLPQVGLSYVVSLLLATATKEKHLLFDAFLSSAQHMHDAMELCAVHMHREATQAQRKAADHARQCQEREAQHKLFALRQQRAAEAALAAAQANHHAVLEARESRIAELEEVVQELRNQVQVQGVALQQQEQSWEAAQREQQREVYACAVELRALQRAHGQATERWVTVQALYSAVREQLHAFQRRRASARHARRADPAGSKLHDMPPPASASRVFLVTADLQHKQTTVPAVERSVNKPVPLNTSSATDITEPTALEALLARTTSNADTPTTPPPLSPIHVTQPLSPPPHGNGGLGRGAAASAAALLSSPPALGHLSSPPDTPLLSTVTFRERRDGEAEGGRLDAKMTTSVLHSPDPLPAPEVTERLSRISVVAPRESLSSCRPSRLNSVASTRRGASALPASGDNLDSTPGVPSRGEAMDPQPVTATAHGVARDGGTPAEETLSPHWEEVLMRTVASTVQEELSRLLAVALPNGDRPVRCDERRTSSSSALGPLLSITSETDTSTDAVADPHGALQHLTSSGAVSHSSLQWMRVCEVARTSAHVNSQLLSRLQKLADSLSVKLKLLEEKDWNKTVAKQLIAGEHTAALRRLIASVEELIHDPLPVSPRHRREKSSARGV